MTKTFRYCLAILLYFISIGVQGQTNYLLKFEHTTHHGINDFYFYIEELTSSLSINNNERIAQINGEKYLINFLRFRETFTSSYAGCCLYNDQLMGEEAIIDGQLPDSLLNRYEKQQKEIKMEYNRYFEKTKGSNSVLHIKLNKYDKVKLVKTTLNYCSCKVGGEKFSYSYDTLIMPTKAVNVELFSKSEKKALKEEICSLLENSFIESCLPDPNRYLKK